MSEQTAENQNPDAAPEATEDTQARPEAQAPDADASPQEEQESDGAESTWNPDRAKEKIRKINSENRALRERANKAEEKAASVDDLQSQNSTLGVENLRLKVGYELGLPLNLATRLQGSTRDEMVADAESLVDLIAPNKPAPSSGRPTPALRPGATAEPIEPPRDDSYPAHWLPQPRQQ